MGVSFKFPLNRSIGGARGHGGRGSESLGVRSETSKSEAPLRFSVSIFGAFRCCRMMPIDALCTCHDSCGTTHVNLAFWCVWAEQFLVSATSAAFLLWAAAAASSRSPAVGMDQHCWAPCPNAEPTEPRKARRFVSLVTLLRVPSGTWSCWPWAKTWRSSCKIRSLWLLAATWMAQET